MSRLEITLLVLLGVCFGSNESRANIHSNTPVNQYMHNTGDVETFVTSKLVKSELWNKLVSTPEQPVSAYLTKLVMAIQKVDVEEVDLSDEYLKRFSDEMKQSRELYDQFVGSQVFRDFLKYRTNLESGYYNSIIKNSEKHHMWFLSNLLHSKQFKNMINSQQFKDLSNKIHDIILDNKHFTDSYVYLFSELIRDMSAFTKTLYEHDEHLTNFASTFVTTADMFKALEYPENVLDPSYAIYNLQLGRYNNPTYLSMSSIGGMIQLWNTIDLSRFIDRAAKMYPLSSSVQLCKEINDELAWKKLTNNSRIDILVK
ncbi:hypothetical protein N9N03_02230 [Chlamydiia bacterium]|nr:hypothetical protein [Chlamydiia bacterium]